MPAPVAPSVPLKQATPPAAKATNTTEFDIRTIFNKTSSQTTALKSNTVLDKDWVSARFMVPDTDLDPKVAAIRYQSMASLKFVDTSIGGNIFINPRPGFNPLTDPKVTDSYMQYNTPGLDPSIMNTGMGEGYSELIDDNQQTVFMEFGLPKFNSLLDFFFRAIDYEDSVLANTGRPATAYGLGKGLGAGIMMIAFPILSLTVYAVKFLASALHGENSLKFYYFDSKMPMYWSSVNTLVTQLVIEQGLLTPMLMASGAKPTDIPVGNIGMPVTLNQTDIDIVNKLMGGDIIAKDTNYIDVFAIITRGQRKAIRQRAVINEMANTGVTKLPYSTDTIMNKVDNAMTFGHYLKEINSNLGKQSGDEKPAKPKPDTANTASPKDGPSNIVKTDGVYKTSVSKELVKKLEKGAKAIDSSIRQGGAFAVFGVEYTGSTSESFSNSVTNVNIGDQTKEMAKKSRALSYDMARGDLFAGDTLGDIQSAVKDVANGILSGMSFGLNNVIAGLSGSGYIEIPKRWDDSSMSFQQNTYKMTLRSPYNSFMSQLQNIYIPLCMLLAGVLPLATGKSSYTSPYLCTLFGRGHTNIKLGMITSVNITRGTSNLAFDKKRNVLGIDVSFTVTDFSTLVTSPVNSSIFTDLFSPNIEDDTPLGTYISVLGNRDILTNKYATKRLPMHISRSLMSLSETFNMDRVGYTLGHYVSNSPLGAWASTEALPASMTNNRSL